MQVAVKHLRGEEDVSSGSMEIPDPPLIIDPETGFEVSDFDVREIEFSYSHGRGGAFMAVRKNEGGLEIVHRLRNPGSGDVLIVTTRVSDGRAKTFLEVQQYVETEGESTTS